MLKKLVIGSTERGLLYRDKRFVRILSPGTYRLVEFLQKYSLELVDIVRNPELKGSAARLLLKDNSPSIDENLVKVSNSARQVAVVYRDAQAADIVAPGEERLFWKGLADIRVARFDISESFELSRDLIRDLSALSTERDILTVKVPEQSVGIVLEAGVIYRELAPGKYAFWKSQRDLSAVILDMRLSAMEVSGQEMLTKDKVSLRVNLSVSYRLTDPIKAVRGLASIDSEIYRAAQLALRQEIGEKTLDQLLESKEASNKALIADMTSALEPYGVAVTRVGVKDLILPGDMRILFNKVVEAEKAAQAQNIRRREETAATRSLLNTARMIESSPVLLRLKEIEAVERISEKVEKLNVYDGLDGVMKGLISLQDK